MLLACIRTRGRLGNPSTRVCSVLSRVHAHMNVPGMSRDGCNAGRALHRLVHHRHSVRLTNRNLHHTSVLH